MLEAQRAAQAFNASKPTWHRDPKYKPNYGRAKSLLPATGLKQVVLHDNASEERRLATESRLLEKQKRWTQRLYNTRRKSFIIRQLIQQEITQAQASRRQRGAAKLLPDVVADSHKRWANMELRSLFYTGGKNLPDHHRVRMQLNQRQNTQELLRQMQDTAAVDAQHSTAEHDVIDEAVLEAALRRLFSELDDEDDEEKPGDLPPIAPAQHDDVTTKREQTSDEEEAHAKVGQFPVTKLVSFPRRSCDVTSEQPARRVSVNSQSCFLSTTAKENAQRTLLLRPRDPLRLDSRRQREEAARQRMLAESKLEQRRASDDPRFRALEDWLDKSEGPTPRDGYAMLSSSNQTAAGATVRIASPVRRKYLPEINSRKRLDVAHIHRALQQVRERHARRSAHV